MPSLASTRIFEVVSAKNEVFKPSSPLNVAAERSADVALQRSYPTFLGDHDGQRLALDHRLGEIGDDDVGRGLETCAPPAELGVGGELLFDVADLDRDHLPLLSLAGEQRLDRRLLLRQVVLLLAQRHLLEAAQAAQARVEDVDDLRLGQREADFERLLRLLVLANDADDLVEIEKDDDHAGEKLEPLVDRRQPMARATHEHRAAVVEPLLQRFAERNDPGRHAVDEHVHVDRDPRLRAR